MTRKIPSPSQAFKILLLVLSAAWIAFVLYLDFAYGMFPRVLFGGMKILFAGYIGLAALVGSALLLRRLLTRQRPSVAEPG